MADDSVTSPGGNVAPVELRAGALARISGATPRRIANAILSGRRAVSWEHVGAAGAGQSREIRSALCHHRSQASKMATCCSHGAWAGRTQVLAPLARAQPRPPGSSAAGTAPEWRLQTGPRPCPSSSGKPAHGSKEAKIEARLGAVSCCLDAATRPQRTSRTVSAYAVSETVEAARRGQHGAHGAVPLAKLMELECRKPRTRARAASGVSH